MGDLDDAKSMKWFYEFELPDGSKTSTNYPDEILKIHTSRRDALRRVLAAHVQDPRDLTAADIASHEGYFTFEMATHFANVTGYEFRVESIENAKLMGRILQLNNVSFEQFDIQNTQNNYIAQKDFVLLYGLMYHLENPIKSLRVACAMARKHILIDTQIFAYDLFGRIEDSSYMHQRQVEGIFALTADYANHREGGSTDFALVPSLNSLIHLLKYFGFRTVEIVEPKEDYYEQFLRKNRVIIYACR